jgi:Pectate lyase superfamily protein
MSTDLSKRMLLSKGALTAGLGVGALALMAPRAEADTPFSSFAFPAAGGTAARTMPQRLAEVKNVRDYGAVGDGVADDTAAIQRTVNWTSAAHRGVIFFPPGTYKVSAPITFNHDGELSIIFQGVGNLSRITGSVSGGILERSNTNTTGGIRVIRDLKIENHHATGHGIMLRGSVGGCIENCMIGAYRGIDLKDSMDTTVKSVALHSGVGAGSVGIIAANAVTVIGCDITLFDHGIRAHNIGLQVIGGRMEMNNVAIMLGRDENGAKFQSTGFLIAATSMERNQTGIYFDAATAGQVTGVSIGSGAPVLCGLDIRGGYSTLISGVNAGGPFSSAAIDARGAGGVTFISCAANNTTSGGAQWLLPDNPANIARIMC